MAPPPPSGHWLAQRSVTPTSSPYPHPQPYQHQHQQTYSRNTASPVTNRSESAGADDQRRNSAEDVVAAANGGESPKRKGSGSSSRPKGRIQTRKDVTPLEAVCKVSTCRKKLASLIVHGVVGKGPDGKDEWNLVPDVTCVECYVPENVGDGRKVAPAGVGEHKMDLCDACGVLVGYGGVRMAKIGEEDVGDWVDPPFGVEVVCERCEENFNFCTNCG
ncbi:hypothetical protein HDU97_004187, partial [Phlyctochytrium planicorne]